MGHPADRPHQHSGGREPKQGPKAEREKKARAAAPTTREKKHRKAKETKPGREAHTATAKASGTAREGKAEQTPKLGPGGEEGKGPGEDRPTTHTKQIVENN